MHLSEKGRAMLTQFEGRRNRVYRDSAGLLTGGVGHLLEGTNWGEGDVIPDELIGKWFGEDIEKAIRVINRAVGFGPDELNQAQQDALISLAFNVPSAFKPYTGLWKSLVNSRHDDVPAQILRWNKATDPKTGKKRVVKGLKLRREAEARLFASGLYPAEQPEPQGRVLKRGDRGPEVERLQRLLNEACGFKLKVDGYFGPKTESYVKLFQLDRDLEQDGTVGPLTWKALTTKKGPAHADPA